MIKSISVNNVSKAFQIYERPEHRLKQFIVPKFQKYFGFNQSIYYKEFFALKNINFDVCKGQTVGIIGLNGSGKSTLLQIICGTLNPTTGSVSVDGRVSALLELGTGFNPEFTGRENVWLNASVLGLSDQQINDRFNSIVTFADIWDFIDRPVKTYSSGMYVRLAFAVAAHVDAEILIVDEALSVGDAAFTQKCMRYIRDFKKNGTLLFVSHDIGSVLNLCDRVIWLENGKIRMDGEASEVSNNYIEHVFNNKIAGDTTFKLSKVGYEKNKTPFEGVNISKINKTIEYQTDVVVQNNLNESNGWKTGAGEIIEAELLIFNTKVNSWTSTVFLKGGEDVVMHITSHLFTKFENPILGFLVKDRLGQELFGENTLELQHDKKITGESDDVIEANFYFKMPMLPNGHYSITVSLADGTLDNNIQHHWLHEAIIFEVQSSRIRYGLVGLNFDKVEFTKVEK